MNAEVQITHPSGQRLPLSERLMAYLKERGTGGFHLGDWLASLGNGDLEQLRARCYAITENQEHSFADHEIDDVVSMAIMAYNAETLEERELSQTELFDLITILLIGSAAELMHKRGWLVFNKPLGVLSSMPIDVSFTPAGKEGIAHEPDRISQAIFTVCA